MLIAEKKNEVFAKTDRVILWLLSTFKSNRLSMFVLFHAFNSKISEHISRMELVFEQRLRATDLECINQLCPLKETARNNYNKIRLRLSDDLASDVYVCVYLCVKVHIRPS